MIAAELEDAGFEVILSGEPCYGACDLDLYARDMADVLVHIGHAPVDDTERVLYELWPQEGDLSVIRKVVPLLQERRVGLVSTVQHVHQLHSAADILADEGFDVVIGSPSRRTPYPGQVLGCSFSAARNTGTGEIIFLGTGMFHPLGIRLATGSRVLACDPITSLIQEADADRLLRVRFGLIQKAKEADRFGIILSSKTGQCRRDLADRLTALSPHAHQILIREVSPDQLLNLGYPCYVNTACPRLAFDDQARFPVPVLTPAEFEILCGIRDFAEYEVDEIT